MVPDKWITYLTPMKENKERNGNEAKYIQIYS